MTKLEKLEQSNGIPGWLELYDLSLHQDIEARAPKGAYIRGMIRGAVGTDLQFVPRSEVLGEAIPKQDACQNSGWVELETLRFHQDIEAVAPVPPYINVRRDEAGHFFPDEPYTIVTA